MPFINIKLANQTLSLLDESKVLAEYYISSAKNGAGEMQDSLQTPRGKHYIRAKIGSGLREGAVIVGRRPTGEVYSAELAAENTSRDWILSRILWLCGREKGKNRMGKVDSMRRFIYIHGTPDSEPMGVPNSIGCIRMRNKDVIDLFDRVEYGCDVFIEE